MMATFGRDLIASGSAACIARTAMAPMERVKLLLQLQAVSQQMSKAQQYKVSTNILWADYVNKVTIRNVH